MKTKPIIIIKRLKNVFYRNKTPAVPMLFAIIHNIAIPIIFTQSQFNYQAILFSILTFWCDTELKYVTL